MAKLTVKDVDLKGKKVLVRVDFNVPLKDGVITNDNRISAALPTIKYIIEQGGRAILFSHLGRVKEEADKEGKSLAPVAADLAAKLGQDVKFIPGVTRGAELDSSRCRCRKRYRNLSERQVGNETPQPLPLQVPRGKGAATASKRQ